MVPVFYNKKYTGSKIAFETMRKAEWIASDLKRNPIEGIDVRSPQPVSEKTLRLYHSNPFVTAVKNGRDRSLASSSGFPWDKGLWESVTNSTGGVLAAMHYVSEHGGVAGSLSSGLHHARTGHGSAFCTFNGLAIAAGEAVKLGHKVLILDFDAHCGGGTHSMVQANRNIYHWDLSCCSFDSYRPANPRCRLAVTKTVERYQDLVDLYLAEMEILALRRKISLVIYNAGMDPVTDWDLGFSGAMWREQRVFSMVRRLKLPTAFVLAGGYTHRHTTEQLVGLHMLTLEAAADA